MESAGALITPRNFEDHLDRLAGCDWIDEAVAENLEIKRNLLGRVAQVRRGGSILSTNTSKEMLLRLGDPEAAF